MLRAQHRGVRNQVRWERGGTDSEAPPAGCHRGLRSTSGAGSAKDAAPSAISDAVTATNKGGDFDRDARRPGRRSTRRARPRQEVSAVALVQNDSAASASSAAKPAVVEAFTRSAAPRRASNESNRAIDKVTTARPRARRQAHRACQESSPPDSSMSRNPTTLPGE